MKEAEKSGQKKRRLRKQRRIGRPNAVLYFLLWLFLRPYYRFRYGVRYDTGVLRGIRGPALILAPHTSTRDHWFIAMALYPARATFVVSEHFYARPILRIFMKLAHAIPKKMFCADMGTIRRLLRARQEGNIMVLFPEGRLSCNGRTGHVTDGTAALVRKLGCDVYTVTANGAALSFPKWAKNTRKGRIDVRAERLFTAEEAVGIPIGELEARLCAAIAHDDAAAMRGICYRSAAMAEGLDGILYRCPSCGREFAMRTEGDRLICACGRACRLTPDYRLTGAPFESILAWYDWQSDMLDLDSPLEARVRIGTPDAKGYMQADAGEGLLHLDRERLICEGQVNGMPLSFVIPTERIAAFPITVGSHIDVYWNNRLFYMSPLPDPRAAVKWVAYLDRLVGERTEAALASHISDRVTVGVAE